MNFIAKHIQAIGLLILTGFVAAAAALYRDVPARVAKPPVAVVAANYSCPMHPEVVSEGPGNCPKCGMALLSAATSAETIPPSCPHVDAAGQATEAGSTPAGCNHNGEAAAGGCCSKKVQLTPGALPSGCTRTLQPQTANSPEQ
jgi:Heavy metal binding domain